MKALKSIIACICLFTSLNAFDFDIGVSGRDDDVNGFYFSIGDYYHAPREEIYAIERRIPRDEVSIAYFLARESRRDINFITDLRLRGKSWWDISLRLGLNPHTLYVVDTYNNYGPPYGMAYGHHHKKYRLSDREIVELVNVRFLSAYHRISPDEVIERRQRGSHYYHNRDENRDRRYKVERERDRFDSSRERREYNKREDRGNSRGRDW